MSRPGAKAGGGRYEREATTLLRATGARVVLLLVVSGHKGDGFEAQFATETQEEAARENARLPAVLRDLADRIEAGEPPAETG